MRTRAGFTLLEITIVLVVVGLITGGILLGRDLVTNAELANFASDIRTYETAVNSFRAKYRAWPGDMTSATEVFGTAAGGCPGGTGTGTCDGNGDRLVSGYFSNPCCVGWTSPAEMYRLWQQLALGGFITGKYSGVPNSTTDMMKSIAPGTNVPLTRRGGYWLLVATPLNGRPTANVMIKFGGSGFSGDMNAIEMLALDAKIDDSFPGTGRIQGNLATAPNCVTSTDPTTARYQPDETYTGCPLVYTF